MLKIEFLIKRQLTDENVLEVEKGNTGSNRNTGSEPELTPLYKREEKYNISSEWACLVHV